MIASEEVVRLEQVRKVYPCEGEDVLALQGIDLTIRRGEFAAIVGPSGSGKSTLMHILGCLDSPTQGRYYLEGEDVSQKTRAQLAMVRAQRLGFVFQSFNLLPALSIEDNIALPLEYGDRKAHSSHRVQELLELVGLGHRLKHRPSALSGGERQRAAVARSLVNDPAIIFADEPTGNLDSVNSKIVIDTFLELNQKGHTIVLVTHESEVAEQTQRIIEIRDGCLVSGGVV